MTLVVLPILVFQRTGSPAQTSIVVALQAVPYLVFGLVAGAVADRSDRRRLMVSCEIVSAGLVASVPVASSLGHLTVPHLYLVALGTATTFVWFDSANFGAIPALVGRPRLVAATSGLAATENVAYVLGPALGGVLASTIGPANAMAVDAVTYAASALLLLSVRRPFREPSPDVAPAAAPPTIRADIREGLVHLWRQPTVRALTLHGAGLSVSMGATIGLVVVYAVRRLGLSDTDWRIGALYTAGAVGALGASLCLPRVRRWLPVTTITPGGAGGELGDHAGPGRDRTGGGRPRGLRRLPRRLPADDPQRDRLPPGGDARPPPGPGERRRPHDRLGRAAVGSRPGRDRGLDLRRPDGPRGPEHGRRRELRDRPRRLPAPRGALLIEPGVGKHLIDLDEDRLGAARAELGTTTIKDTVNEAL